MSQEILGRILAALVALLSANAQQAQDIQTALVSAQALQKQITVDPKADLQVVLDGAPEDAVLFLPAGAVFTGHFVCSKAVRVTTLGASFPLGARATLTDSLGVIASPDSQPAFKSAPGANGCVLDAVEVRGGIEFGQGNDTDATQLPTNVVVRHVLQNATNLKRAINLNATGAIVVDSYIYGPKVLKQDSQAIWCNTCSGISLINNHLEAAGEVVLFGGDRVLIQGLVPSDIVIASNEFTRPIELKAQPGQWNVKNLLEFKNGQRITITGNAFSNHWADAQQCYSIVFTPRDQYGDGPWTTVRDVVFEHNTLKNVGCAINIIGDDDHWPNNPRTTNIAIRDNVFIVSKALGGTRGQCALIGRAPQQLQFERNVCIGDGSSAFYTYRGGAVTQSEGFVFKGNYFVHGTYGFLSDVATPPNQALAANYPNAVWEGNTVSGGTAKTYPAGTSVLAVDAFKALFSDLTNGVLAQ
jgi:hypothetical protein